MTDAPHSGLLRGHSRSALERRRALHAYGVIVVHVERSRTGGIRWTTVEEVGDRVRRRTYASGPGGHGYWERIANPDGKGVWRLLREELYLPWRGPDSARIQVERVIYGELWQQWGTW